MKTVFIAPRRLADKRPNRYRMNANTAFFLKLRRHLRLAPVRVFCKHAFHKTLENNKKIRDQPQAENGFSGDSGGEEGIRTLETVPRLRP